MWAAAKGHSKLGIPQSVGKEFVGADATAAAPNPSQAQIDAGNYPKKHISYAGIPIAIETEKGGTRSGVGADGAPWSVVMPCDYGYIKRTVGADDEQVDVYVGPLPESDAVFVIEQIDALTGQFDEFKVMLGYATADAAMLDYLNAFSDGRASARIGALDIWTIDELKAEITATKGRELGGSVEGLNEWEIAEQMRDGKLTSPQKLDGFWLFDLRVTGTDVAYRDKGQEFAVRDPALWLSEDFVKRVGGVPVTFNHPERGGLNHDEFENRCIGGLMFGYVKDDEVWGIARIYDRRAAEMMQTTHRSTSPGVRTPEDCRPIVIEEGLRVLPEGLPLVLDHLAVCKAGVWDKSGPPSGIRLDGKAESVAEKTEAELEKERADAEKARADSEKSRADSAETEREDAKKRADAAEAELEKGKAMNDRRKRRHDRAKHDGEHMDCSKCDAAEEESEKEAVEKAEREDSRKKRHDSEKHDGAHNDCSRCDEAAKVETVEAGRGTEIHDARVTELAETVKRQSELIATLTRQPTLEERDQLSTIFLRADSIMQALGEKGASHPLGGELPLEYRKRILNALRVHTPTYKEYVINDALDPQAFDLVEKEIYREAEAKAHEPIADKPGYVREIKTINSIGKKESRFIGDHRAPWLPYMTPNKFAITRINRPQGQVYR